MQNDLNFMLGQWKEFRKWEEDQHREIADDLKELSQKIDSLRLWRASVIGASMILGAIGGILAEIVAR